MAPTITCPQCGHSVERAAFCTNCGRALTLGPSLPTDRSTPQDSAPLPPNGTTTTSNGSAGSARAGRMGRRFGALRVASALLPPLRGVRKGRYRWVAGIGLLLVLILLLFDEAGLAIALSGCIVPALFLMYFYDVDLNEEQPKLTLVATIVLGVLAGILIAIVNTWLVDRLWIKHATVNIGAAGFGGHFAQAAGFPPLSILVLSGIVIPLAAEALQIIGPYELRRWTSVRNDVMDGITFGAAAGAGFAAAGTIAYYWPLITDGTNPGASVAGWTATLIGLVVVRPLLLGTVTALLCAGIWHYALTGRVRDLIVPAGAGLAGAIIVALGDLAMQPSGARLELLWLVVVLFVLGGVMRFVLGRALRQSAPEAAATHGRPSAPFAPRERTSEPVPAEPTPEPILAPAPASAEPEPSPTEPAAASAAARPNPDPAVDATAPLILDPDEPVEEGRAALPAGDGREAKPAE